MNKYLFWDFDGTLGGRIHGQRGLAWAMCLLEAVREIQPKSRMTIHDIVPHLKQGFPWHEPEKAHVHLGTPELWWAHLRKVLSRAYLKLGFSQEEAAKLAKLAQKRFLDLECWELFQDAIPTLKELQSYGWKHIIVSNHVPELHLIISHLGLDSYLIDVINSAEVGFEKPNPKIFEVALGRAFRANDIWMIGDNYDADVLGAERVGLKAILVRKMDPRAKYNYPDLYGAKNFLLAAFSS